MISGNDLIENGWTQGPMIGAALGAARELADSGLGDEAILERLERVRQNPGAAGPNAGPALTNLAEEVRRVETQKARGAADELRKPQPYAVWGQELIEEGTTEQMQGAMSLPVSVAGALMPDAHLGYGLPVGGVLATDGVVIPWAVGVDIACRMRLSVFDVSPDILSEQGPRLKEVLLRNTNFGAGGKFKEGRRGAEHEVLDDPAWEDTAFLKGLKDTADAQLGTSGSGNHFVEWGILELANGRRHLALLSHSGSRGVGYKIATRYSKIAKQKHPNLHKSVADLSWLDLTSEEGEEYWAAMNLAGRFASANHEVIHEKVAQAIGEEISLKVENHHNFAWLEEVGGREAVVHRKGATPAGEGVLGIIPGSMGDPGYVVEGKGDPNSINSASHGAGRRMSRTKAFASIEERKWRAYLEDRGVSLIGGGLDEAPQAYKSIDEVLSYQRDLVRVLGRFVPKIVRMDGSSGATRRKKKKKSQSK